MREPVVGGHAAITLTHQPRSMDDALQAMSPSEFVAKMEEMRGPLNGAHYILQRGSRIQLVDEHPQYIDGALSVVDCALNDAENPASGRTLWIGGLELEGAPDAFNVALEHKRVITVLGHDVQHVSAQWRDAQISDQAPHVGARGVTGRTVRGMDRTLDAGVDEEWSDGGQTWRREISLSAETPSAAEFRWDDDPCPHDMTLNFVLRDHLEVWEFVNREGEVGPQRGEPVPPETVATATFIALKVGDRPEIVEPAQRALRARSATAITNRTRPVLSGEIAPRDLPPSRIDALPLRRRRILEAELQPID